LTAKIVAYVSIFFYLVYIAYCYNWDWVAWNDAVGHTGKDLEGIGYGILELAFRYLSGGK